LPVVLATNQDEIRKFMHVPAAFSSFVFKVLKTVPLFPVLRSS